MKQLIYDDYSLWDSESRIITRCFDDKLIKRYNPEKYPSIYRRFSELKTDSDILEFVKKYGLIISKESDIHQQAVYGNEDYLYYDDLNEIHIETSDMSIILKIIKSLYYGYNENSLRKFCCIESGNEFKRCKIETIEKQVKRIVAGKLSAKLKNLVVADIFYDGKAQPFIRHEPINLLGFMWLQVSRQFTEVDKIKVCKNCNKIFETTYIDQFGNKQKYKINKEYCSDSCKVQYHRKCKNQMAIITT